MPTPKKGEKKSDYMKRCIPEVMGEGKKQDQAIGKCSGMWAEYHLKERFGLNDPQK